MVVSEQVRWDAVLNDRTAEVLSKNPELAKLVRAQRRHVDVFHEMEWAGIQLRLWENFRIHLSDDDEPHWTEPWKAAYWKPSTDLRGNVTWLLTGPLSADATSIAHYLAKGWHTRLPVEEAEALEHSLMAAELICPECHFDFGTKQTRDKHRVEKHGITD